MTFDSPKQFADNIKTHEYEAAPYHYGADLQSVLQYSIRESHTILFVAI